MSATSSRGVFVDNKNNKLDGKSKQIIVGIFACLILLTFSAVMLIAAQILKNSDSNQSDINLNNSTTSYIKGDSTTTPENLVGTVSDANVTKSQFTEDGEVTELISVEGLEEFTKTGENQISASPDNQFIKLIVEEKSVDSERLVAIYAVPDLGNNFVLEFDNKRDSDGNIIRSPKTLKRIYHINKERSITVATGKPTGNEGVDYGTSLMTYYLVTDVVMPEFPDYFSDVG
jgi:hypothetical protein